MKHGFLIENKIDTDGDFSYPFQNFQVATSDTEERAFEQVKIIINSLLEVKSNSEWITTNVKKAAHDWLNGNKKFKPNFHSPSYDLGNCSIEINVIPVTISTSLSGCQIYTKKD